MKLPALATWSVSGGQKVVLALAYCLAIHKMFAGDIGLLVLDEPTVFLDDDNIDKLVTVFDSLREIAHNTGQQVLVITHEKRLEACFDSVIDLGVV